MQTTGRISRNTEGGIPWSAETLNVGNEIVCRSCKATITADQVKVWHNLPSDYWAEMMDFWHCHKPNPETGGVQMYEDMSKAYAATNRLAARSGIGLVNTPCFIIFPGDCPTLHVS